MNAISARNRYPRAGDVAILCEGDIAGFEVDLLEKFIANRAQQVFVDVWPCGTQDSIYGMADAIGRSRPLIVVEDRDFRTLEQAEKDCTEKRNDRSKRGNDIRYWRAWERNEIENYLIEPEVLVPVLAHYFGIVDHERIRERLESVVTCLRIDQAAQFALYQFHHNIPSKSRYIGGLPRRTARPRWNAEKMEIVAPEMAAVKSALTKELKNRTELHQRHGKSIECGKYVVQFDSKCREWSGVKASSSEWRIEWAGKDILICLFRWLAAEYGIILPTNQSRIQVNWEALSGEKDVDGLPARKDEELERQILHELQPLLVKHFLDYLPNASCEVRQEWDAILDQIKRIAVK